MIKLGRALSKLNERLPFHLTPVVERFVRETARLQPLPARLVMPQLLNARLSATILDRLLPDRSQAELFHTLLRNTVSPTVLRAGQKTNVIPDQATAELDGRTLPNFSVDVLIDELRAIVDDDQIEFEVIKEHPATINDPPDSELWSAICDVVKERAGLPAVPYMIPGFTDGQSFGRLGARWYGFSPLWLDVDGELRFSDLFHGYDERIPEDGYHWGVKTLYQVVERFCRSRI